MGNCNLTSFLNGTLVTNEENNDIGLEDTDKFQPEKIIFPLAIFISLLGVGGNGLVLYFIFFVKWSHFSSFLFHLSLADFIYLASQIVTIIHSIMNSYYEVKISLFYSELFTYISHTVNLCLLAIISMGRCLSVLFPIWYRLHSLQYTSTLLCILAWVVAITINVVRALRCSPAQTDRTECCTFTLAFAVLMWILLSVTILCIMIMLFKIKCISHLHPPRKLYIILGLTLLFFFCTCPLGIQIFISDVFHIPHSLELAILLSCINSSANPLVYYFVGRMGRQRRQKHVREILQKTLGEELDQSSGPLSNST